MRNLITGRTFLLLAAALLSVACAPGKKLTSYQRTDMSMTAVLEQAGQYETALSDSLRRMHQNELLETAETKLAFAEPIPAAQVQMTIPTRSLLDLPEGAMFGNSSGRAGVEARRQGDNIIFTSRCDSISRRCTLLERQTFRQRNTIDSLQEAIERNSGLSKMTYERSSNAARKASGQVERKAPPARRGSWFAAGAVLGIAGGAGAQLLWKRYGVGSLIKGIFTKISL